METPVFDFIEEYKNNKTARFHMPGHKGKAFLGSESFDITEISGADSLYEASGIIAKSEENAASLFGSERTMYSTEGSSHCIKAMLYLAAGHFLEMRPKNGPEKETPRPLFLASRNVHRSFVYGAALIDADVEWIPCQRRSGLCDYLIDADSLKKKLKGMKAQGIIPAGVYITSPDYLGNIADVKTIARIAHEFGTLLLVDNAHGAYLKFAEGGSDGDVSMHPVDLGADIVCDSAHKTLPVLTGGAYLHLSKTAPGDISDKMKAALALFGSTSPSYLVMASLDLVNSYIADGYAEKLAKITRYIENTREKLRRNGWQAENSDPLRITVRAPKGISGDDMAQILRNAGAECEHADRDYLVLMFTTENTEEEIDIICDALGVNDAPYEEAQTLEDLSFERVMSIREAVFSNQEKIPVREAKGRICASPAVSCPPAVPVVVSGEVITSSHIDVMMKYGISEVSVVKV
ncbi:MAG: aminotransferase class I/II-fold pyridoxal phosphate-dependent enzyme [Lachnospiraceae bacterium]|jgi:arginine decarboxylase